METKSIIRVTLLKLGFFVLLLFPRCGNEDSEISEDLVADVDGNVYKTVVIGKNRWMKENLRTTKFRDGSAIALVEDVPTWISATSPAYCWPENDVKYKTQ
jgi:hypothetical protein